MAQLKQLIHEIHCRSLWRLVAMPPHRWLLTSCLVLATLACARHEDPAYARGSTLVIAYPASPSNPFANTSAEHLVFLPLATWDENWELEGRLARSWEHSQDYREWTYHLRTDVLWHDGVPVTAHDVKFTLELLTHPAVLWVPPSLIESVTVHNDSTITIRFARDRGFFDTGVVYYPRHLLEQLDPKRLAEWDFWTRPVGNGPYRFVRSLPMTMMEFEANPEYFGPKPAIERVVLKFVDEEAGVTELLSGNVDVMSYTNPAWAPKLAADPRFRPYYWSYVGVARSIYWRNDHPLFRDPRVRRAFTLAIDRQELLRLLNLPPNISVSDVIYTPRQFLRGELPAPLAYDPEQARALLAEAGWRDVDGDGVRERDGIAFRFTAIVSDWPGFTETAIYVQSKLRRLGISMEIEVLEGAVVGERVGSGDFESAFASIRHEARWLLRVLSSIGYTNTYAIEILDRAMTTADPGAVDGMYRELMEIFEQDLPVTFLHPVVRTFFVHRRIQGLSTPFRADPLRFTEHLWLEEETYESR